MIPSRYLTVQLRFDRESFDAFKELLRVKSAEIASPDRYNLAAGEGSSRITREALKRVFDQIRDLEYDKPPLVSLDHE